MTVGDKPTVVHDVGTWLPRTKTWLYREVTGVTPEWRSRVLADRLVNTGEFDHDDVFSIRDRYGPIVWFGEIAMLRAGLTRRPLLLRAELRRLQPDVLHSHFGHIGWANARFANRWGIRHVVSFYGYDVTRLPRQRKWLERYQELFETADAVLCEGPYMGDQLVRLGCPAKIVRVYPLGVDLERIPFRPKFWDAGTPLRVLIAASFREKKGIPIALEALARLRNARTDLDLSVTLVGTAGGSAASLRERDRIHEVIRRRRLDDIVDRLGSRDHKSLLGLAAEHHLFLSPSLTATDGDTEGGAPVGLIEMAAAGLPVVSTTHCDIPNVLATPNRAQLVAEGSIDELVEALHWFVENRDAWAEIARANRDFVERYQNSSLQGRRLAAIYSDVAGLLQAS